MIFLDVWRSQNQQTHILCLLSARTDAVVGAGHARNQLKGDSQTASWLVSQSVSQLVSQTAKQSAQANRAPISQEPANQTKESHH